LSFLGRCSNEFRVYRMTFVDRSPIESKLTYGRAKPCREANTAGRTESSATWSFEQSLVTDKITHDVTRNNTNHS
jgi:hypothetical protein